VQVLRYLPDRWRVARLRERNWYAKGVEWVRLRDVAIVVHPVSDQTSSQKSDIAGSSNKLLNLSVEETARPQSDQIHTEPGIRPVQPSVYSVADTALESASCAVAEGTQRLMVRGSASVLGPIRRAPSVGWAFQRLHTASGRLSGETKRATYSNVSKPPAAERRNSSSSTTVTPSRLRAVAARAWALRAHFDIGVSS
jgi:hypothetical protein